MPRPTPDLTGQRMGRWLVIERAEGRGPTHWICRCECGTLRVVSAASLLQGMSRSCGCLRNETNRRRLSTPEGRARMGRGCYGPDRIGQRFGRLVVLAKIYRAGRWYYQCRCDCGTELEVLCSNLIKPGNTTSCGCYRRDHAPVVLAAGTAHAIERFCPICGTRFFGTWKQIYCSAACSHRSRYPLRYRHCLVCGVRFRTHSGKRYCHESCRRRAAQLSTQLLLEVETLQLEQNLEARTQDT